jgi:hypothetical protein
MSYLKLKEIVENDFYNKDKFEDEDKYSVVLAYNQYKESSKIIVNRTPNILFQLDKEDVIWLCSKYRYLEDSSKQHEMEWMDSELQRLEEKIDDQFREIELIKKNKSNINK